MSQPHRAGLLGLTAEGGPALMLRDTAVRVSTVPEFWGQSQPQPFAAENCPAVGLSPSSTAALPCAGQCSALGQLQP